MKASKILFSLGILVICFYSRSYSQWAEDALILDLNADTGITMDNNNVVLNWENTAPKVTAGTKDFDTPTSRNTAGRPVLKENVTALHGRNTVTCREQDLINGDETAFDHLTLGAGYTWFAVFSPYQQAAGGLTDVNVFFGNLKNSGGYEGFWGGLNDDRSVWMGSRKEIASGRWSTLNPKVHWANPLDVGSYYILAGRMAAGTGTVLKELFVDDMETSKATANFTVDDTRDPSMMAICTERDATNHPGHESFDGEIARFLVYERALSDSEMADVDSLLRKAHLEAEVVSISKSQVAQVYWSFYGGGTELQLGIPVQIDLASAKFEIHDVTGKLLKRITAQNQMGNWRATLKNLDQYPDLMVIRFIGAGFSQSRLINLTQ